MSDPKHQQTERTPATGMPKPKKANKQDRAQDDPPPGELVEGEGSPGLTITGGGGHA
jgi:hypothetical protein